MNSIAGQYSTVSLYSLYQAGQNGSAPSQANQNGLGSGSNSPVQDTSVQDNSGSGQAAGDSQSTSATSQNNGGGDASTAPPPSTYNGPVFTVTTGETNDSGDQTDPSGPFTNNTAANADYQAMVLNLGSGNLAAAAKDYAQLQTDLKLHSHHGGMASFQVVEASAENTSGNVLNVTV